eukprot:CAMPEP_0117563880 /NCGR_PEP_ID=MMETSP0784-20121206/55738_1 /TAXON_ID=39447 /ORGANISM="" /LENGTH=35 /DNA_ID= /DNA_START= /DNA_END= /DNA_ORIENTATION=
MTVLFRLRLAFVSAGAMLLHLTFYLGLQRERLSCP